MECCVSFKVNLTYACGIFFFFFLPVFHPDVTGTVDWNIKLLLPPVLHCRPNASVFKLSLPFISPSNQASLWLWPSNATDNKRVLLRLNLSIGAFLFDWLNKEQLWPGNHFLMADFSSTCFFISGPGPVLLPQCLSKELAFWKLV